MALGHVWLLGSGIATSRMRKGGVEGWMEGVRAGREREGGWRDVKGVRGYGDLRINRDGKAFMPDV